MDENKKKALELSDDDLENAAGGVATPDITELPEVTTPSAPKRPGGRPGPGGKQNNDN